MKLKYLAFLLLVGFVLGEEDEMCGAAEVISCVSNYMEYASADPSEKEVCSQVGRFLTCIREAEAGCDSDDLENSLDDDTAELQTMLDLNCKDVEENPSQDSKECFQNNENYIHACLPDSIQETIDTVGQNEEADENVFTCAVYTLTVNCAMRRIEEKCGEEAMESFVKELDDVPEEVKDACLSESNLRFYGISLLEKRKRRK